MSPYERIFTSVGNKFNLSFSSFLSVCSRVHLVLWNRVTMTTISWNPIYQYSGGSSLNYTTTQLDCLKLLQPFYVQLLILLLHYWWEYWVRVDIVFCTTHTCIPLNRNWENSTVLTTEIKKRLSPWKDGIIIYSFKILWGPELHVFPDAINFFHYKNLVRQKKKNLCHPAADTASVFNIKKLPTL